MRGKQVREGWPLRGVAEQATESKTQNGDRDMLIAWMNGVGKSTEAELKGRVCGPGSYPNWRKHTTYIGNEKAE